MTDLLAYQLDTGDECSLLDSSSEGKMRRQTLNHVAIADIPDAFKVGIHV